MRRTTDKLPRGSYFYVKLENLYFAGREPVMQEVKDVSDQVIHSSYMKGAHGLESWPGGNELWRKREADDYHRLKKHYPEALKRRRTIYNVARDFKAPSDPVQKPTGAHRVKLVEDFAAAKQFRRKSQAEVACVELNRLYGSLNAKATIELHEGDKNVDR